MEEEYGGCFEENQLTQSEMISAYRALSTTDNLDIDTNDEIDYVQESIDELYDEDFKRIDSYELQKNHVLLNNKFVELVKYCKQKNNYKKVGYLFLGFCYYFDLDEAEVFKNLHEKLQLLIRKAAMEMCGQRYYESVEKQNSEKSEIKVTSLMSFIKH